ncbi:vacuolar protein sorting-associated protein 37B [Callorhinchus milii]|uniref:VPS37B subunit of ESCRT-I a n=1 Tax=Callorhinchus milii TaxID=7868 RepID=V9L7H7_CALMI|nr:vacuolar protein sorting-associated protein 37B [Callorhinchus milii]|eukprot:gi/632968198/ref/XP_007900396.1/ PREDICTED: vacuolar protein sorting-associated protein 37B [Callorhinchus milii]
MALVDAGKLSALSVAQLHQLLADEEQLKKMAEEIMVEAPDVQSTKDMSLASNRSLAEQNLQYDPKLNQLKLQLISKYQELQTVFEAYQMRKSKLDSKSSCSSIDTLLALLQTEGAKIEEETENMAKTFLDGEIPLDTFIDEYQSKRKLAHQRRVKIEKLQEMVLKGQRPAQPHVAQLHWQPDPAPASQTPNPTTDPTFPIPAPRRVLPPPSLSQGFAYPNPFMGLPPGPSHATPYPASPFPPIPPRSGTAAPTPIPQPGYPQQYRLPYAPPPVPQKSAPQAGFILQ